MAIGQFSLFLRPFTGKLQCIDRQLFINLIETRGSIITIFLILNYYLYSNISINSSIIQITMASGCCQRL